MCVSGQAEKPEAGRACFLLKYLIYPDMAPLPPLDMADVMQPSLVAPVVAWLCHEDCEDNGSVIEIAGGWAAKCKPMVETHSIQ